MPRSEQHIKLYDKPNHINEFLTHWTGRNKSDDHAFNILSKIVDTGKLKFSINRISFPKCNYEITNQMICFTDTPIKQSLGHCERYNYFGLSFNKSEMIEYGASPVLYLVDNRKKHQDFIMTVKPPENEKRNLAGWFSSILQPYNSKQFSDDWAEFYEREWRIIRILPFHWIAEAEKSQGRFNEYPFKMQIERVQTSDNPNDEEFYLPFDKSIIKNIIIPSEFSYKEKARELIKRNDLKCDLIIIKKHNRQQIRLHQARNANNEATVEGNCAAGYPI